eukprot:TRINITY_DN780159_c0_g1_i1.p1 TRINITY_DN780159_c0_g1~~TRINITY_DN780159_c0_g1_i1.p1  ORF type:complete len:593 (+),score=216.28 TRINITY_DN780159_c0_g1_i1:66-1844(+)
MLSSFIESPGKNPKKPFDYENTDISDVITPGLGFLASPPRPKMKRMATPMILGQLKTMQEELEEKTHLLETAMEFGGQLSQENDELREEFEKTKKLLQHVKDDLQLCMDKKMLADSLVIELRESVANLKENGKELKESASNYSQKYYDALDEIKTIAGKYSESLEANEHLKEEIVNADSDNNEAHREILKLKRESAEKSSKLAEFQSLAETRKRENDSLASILSRTSNEHKTFADEVKTLKTELSTVKSAYEKVIEELKEAKVEIEDLKTELSNRDQTINTFKNLKIDSETPDTERHALYDDLSWTPTMHSRANSIDSPMYGTEIGITPLKSLMHDKPHLTPLRQASPLAAAAAPSPLLLQKPPIPSPIKQQINVLSSTETEIRYEETFDKPNEPNDEQSQNIIEQVKSSEKDISPELTPQQNEQQEEQQEQEQEQPVQEYQDEHQNEEISEDISPHMTPDSLPQQITQQEKQQKQTKKNKKNNKKKKEIKIPLSNPFHRVPLRIEEWLRCEATKIQLTQSAPNVESPDNPEFWKLAKKILFHEVPLLAKKPDDVYKWTCDRAYFLWVQYGHDSDGFMNWLQAEKEAKIMWG